MDSSKLKGTGRISDCANNDHDLADKCYKAAIKYLARKQRSEAEVFRYLRSRNLYSDEVIKSTINRLKNQKLINDMEFARAWKDDRLAFKPRSRSFIKRELMEKGIDSAIIDSATSEIDDMESALRIAQKHVKHIMNLPYKDFHRRLAAFLGRRGYSHEIINKTVQKIWQDYIDKQSNNNIGQELLE